MTSHRSLGICSRLHARRMCGTAGGGAAGCRRRCAEEAEHRRHPRGRSRLCRHFFVRRQTHRDAEHRPHRQDRRHLHGRIFGRAGLFALARRPQHRPAPGPLRLRIQQRPGAARHRAEPGPAHRRDHAGQGAQRSGLSHRPGRQVAPRVERRFLSDQSRLRRIRRSSDGRDMLHPARRAGRHVRRSRGVQCRAAGQARSRRTRFSRGRSGRWSRTRTAI